ncbi:MAG: LacI family DNA-binding transcriptional regulator [Firmicutes bacterium]|uniref:Transcriptional regulator, LacI family n=1 Tax=Melghirimyces thermohalophilus TaxID=1236220 RepID=A0A1G6LD82_9BACL|nr:LacI family DNA-binding transcriptional regulator [Melghirimyces thermohalophilus]MDA8353832.1 LacI family DNA-binding transcriptional regulator [Bacillota bacterium]SDC41171.1 transcriptional regulator, LacI family [Melghirimyces thermohalophilus]
MKPTIYDVAEKAGVSIATVSYVMNNQKVGKKSREKVLKAMEELNYKPSLLASALTGKRTTTIGFLLPDLANPFVAEMARRVEDRAHERGFNVVICSTDSDKEKEALYTSLLRQKRVDGFIFAGDLKNVDVVKELVGEQTPVVLLAVSHPAVSVNSVTVDDFTGGYQVASHLISLGHKRIAVIAEEAISSRERIRGYKHALQDQGIEIDEDLIVTSDSSFEDGERLADELLNTSHPPTAIFACNDILAIGSFLAARKKNRSIPGDLSVAGFDNTLLSKSSDPPLTIVEQPIQDMCSQAVDLLIEEIEGKSTRKQRIVLLPDLIIRQSTGPCRF